MTRGAAGLARGLAVRAAAVILGCAAAGPAAALHLCVDEKGQKRYQQSPCPQLDIRSGIVPVAADRLSEANVLEAVKRFDAAQTKRDARALMGLITKDFVATVYAAAEGQPRRQVERYDYRQFVNSNARAFHVVSEYNLKRSGCTVTIADDVGTCACSLTEAAVITSRKATLQLRDRVQVVIEAGQLLVRRVDQEYLGGDVETRSIRLQ